MLPIDESKITKANNDLIDDEIIETNEAAEACLRCGALFVSSNPKYYRLCERCKRMQAIQHFDAMVEASVWNPEDESMDLMELPEDVIEYVGDWDSYGAASNDPWERVDYLIDLARKVKI